MDILYIELNNLGLELQPNKTNLVDFGKAGCVNRFSSVRCVNKHITILKKARFLGILFDKLVFESQCQNLKNRVLRINSMFKYINGITKDLEVNTALLLYKGLIRSVIDYGSIIFVPNNDCKSRMLIEQAQFAGLRSAMGYRNSTPTNVIVAESKVTYIRDRAKMLAKNFCSKILVYGDESLIGVLSDCVRAEVRQNLCVPWRKYSIVTETWLKCTRHRDVLCSHVKFPVFKDSFWMITDSLLIDVQIGKDASKLKYNQESIVNSFKNKYNLSGSCLLIFTDGSKIDDRSTGCSFYIYSIEMGYYIGLNNYCKVFSAEACAVSEALKWCYHHNISKDILILTDSQSTIKALVRQ